MANDERSRVADFLSRTVTARPLVTILVLLAVTVGLGAGFTRFAEQADSTVFLPEDSEVARAAERMDALFGGSHDTVSATIIFRGPALTPDGLAQISRTVGEVQADSRVAPLLSGRIVSVALPLEAALGTDDFASVSQQQVDEATSGNPALERLVGNDADGTQVTVATVRLDDLAKATETAATAAETAGDSAEAERLAAEAEAHAEILTDAELAIRDIAKASQGPLAGAALSSAITDEENAAASGSEMTLLIVVALVVIAALLWLFTRSILDLILSLVGLLMTIVWMLGAQGWLGPNGLGVIGGPNPLTIMVPIMLIGLVVDYAIQSVGLYREQRGEGHDAPTAARRGLRSVIIPLGLAAITTVVSFLANVTSPIPANVDLGIVAGIGVAFGLNVMLTLIFSARALVDRRLESRGELRPARQISGAIPGVGAAAEALGGRLAPRPLPFLVAIGVITILLGIASTRLETTSRLPGLSARRRRGHHQHRDSRRGLRGLDRIREGADRGRVHRRPHHPQYHLTSPRPSPRTCAGPREWPATSRPRPDYCCWTGSSTTARRATTTTPNCAPWLWPRTSSDSTQRSFRRSTDRLEAIDPEGFAQVAVDDPDGADAMLLRFEALSGDKDADDPHGRGHRRALVRRPRRTDRHLRRYHGHRDRRHHDQQPDHLDHHHDPRGPHHSDHLLLDHRAPPCAGLHRSRADRARAHLGVGHHGTAGALLHTSSPR